MNNQKMIKQNPAALRIASIYLLIGGLWILFSDKAVEAIASDQDMQMMIGTIKGWGYVFVTAMLLYWLIHRYTSSMQERDERVTNILNAAMDAVISIDKSHRIVLFNPAAEKMFGYTAREIIGLPVDILLPKLYRADHNRQIDNFGQTGITNRHMNGYMEITGVKKNGDEFPIDTSISQIVIDGGKLFTAILRDVTEHKRAGETLRKLHDELELQFQQRTSALSEANALLETMLEYVPDQIYFKDSKSRFIKNSKSQAIALGLSDSHEAVGKTDFDFFPHAQRSFDEEQEIMRSGNPLVDFEEQVIWPDGKETWVSTSKVPLRNNEGEIIGTFGISRDITERKRAEESLRKAKDELEIRVVERTAELNEANKQLQIELKERELVEAALRENEKRLIQTQVIAGLGTYIIDITTGKWDGSEIFDNILGINETFERTMETWPLLIHPKDRQVMLDYFTNEVINKHLRFDKEYRIIRQSDQVERWVHTLGELEFDSENRPARMVGTVQDITESKQTKTQLEYQAYLLKQINDAVIATDDQYKITVWNRGAEMLYGWNASEAVGQKTTEIIHSDMNDAERDEILHQLHEHGEYHMELVQYRKNGTPVYVDASTISIHDESGQVTGVLSVNRDITERKLTENVLRESESNARSLVNLSRKLEQAQTYSEALNAALDEIKVVIGYQSAWTYLFSEDKQYLQLLTITGEKSQIASNDFPILSIKGDRFLEEISEGKDIVVVEDARTDPRTNKDIVAQLGNRTILNIPIIFMDRQLGIFGTGTFGDEGVRLPTAIQLDYLRALASHIAVTLDRIHLLIKRKQMEAELYKSEELLRLGYDTAKLGVWQNIVSTGIINFDERARTHYGFDKENVPLADVVAHVHPEDLDRLNQAVATTTDPANNGRYGTEYRVIHPDGSVHWLAVQARVYYEKDNPSLPVSWFGTSQEITERKQAEEQIRQNAIRFEALAEVSQALALVSSDYQAVLDMTTERVAKLIGDSCNIRLISDDGQSLELMSLYHPDAEALPFFREILTSNPQRTNEGMGGRVVQSGQPILIPVVSPEEFKASLPPQVWPILERISIHSLLIVPLRAEGRVLGTLTIARDQPGLSYTLEDQTFLQDMADRAALSIVNTRLYVNVQELNTKLEQRVIQRTVQLETANKELEAFSYSVSHDLRSPLRGIDGWSLALLEDYGPILDEQGQAHIQRVRAEAQRMGNLIDDILHLSRITRAEMKKERVDLSALAETVATRLDETKPENRVVEFLIQKGLTAMGDPKLLDVLFTNLLGNAFKFTSKKQESLIEFGQTVVEGEKAFYVRDNGAGFDMNYANKLFGAFQRMHKASEFPGTGIGLATVQRVINRHGGSIWASSELGQGATFYFTLEDK